MAKLNKYNFYLDKFGCITSISANNEEEAKIEFAKKFDTTYSRIELNEN